MVTYSQIYNPFRSRRIAWSDVQRVDVGRTVLPVTRWMEYSQLIVTDEKGRRVRVSASVLLPAEEVRRLLEVLEELRRQYAFALDVDPSQFPTPRATASG